MHKGFHHFKVTAMTAACLVLLTSTACSDDKDIANNTTGTLSLSVEVDNTLHYPDGSTVESVMAYRPADSEIAVRMQALFGNYSHTWESFDDFPEAQRYFVGEYQIDATYGYSLEGYNMPDYRGRIMPEVLAGRHVDECVTLGLVSTVSTVSFDAPLVDYFSSVKAFLHSDGGGYFEYGPPEERMLYLTPGNTSLILNLTLPDGRIAGFEAFSVADAKNACLYEYKIGLDFNGDIPVVTCSLAGESNSVELTEEFLSAVPPLISTSGWSTDATLLLPEGDNPVEPVVATVTSSSPLRHLYLSTNSPSLRERNFPEYVDLMNLSGETETLIRGLGLEWSGSSTDMNVDFTGLLGNLSYLTALESISTFGLSAVDMQGRVGPPTMLRVETTPVGVDIMLTPDVMVGAPEASVTVESSAIDFASHVAVQLRSDDGAWDTAQITSIVDNGDGSFIVRFAIPDGSAPVNGRLVYCDEPRATFTLKRVMPEFSLEIDPFATYAFVKVDASDREIVDLVTKRLYLYVDGKRGSVLSRDSENGIISLTGLSPSSSYRLTSTMMDVPASDDFTAPQVFTTESVQQLPNFGFEERRDGPSYSNMPSGGRYSQTVVAIFNWQNHKDFNMQVPKDWANTNAKTFNMHSANRNTWYMQPSVYVVMDDVHSGSFATCLRSVAFDVDGEKIPDYTQTGEPYLNYSPIIPRISSRAAGKLFLGSYAFDPTTMTERYNDIVPWGSRPVSLNGYYKYNPSENDPSDAGLALVEVYGKVDGREEVIASGKVYLPVANSYTAFSAQLSYDRFGVKASGIKVMFASSHSIGSISEETASVPTVPNAQEAASVGSTLWLDHVNLSY